MKERIATDWVVRRRLIVALQRLAAAMEKVQQYDTTEAWDELADANFYAEKLYLKYVRHVNQQAG